MKEMMLNKMVAVVGRNRQVYELFTKAGAYVLEDVDEDYFQKHDDYDLIVFTGGADVDPSFYGEENIASSTQPARDEFEKRVFLRAKKLKIPCVGICRGAQFLNVMNGGRLWQHVTDHAISGTHEAFCLEDGKKYQVTSTHHQMMKPGDGARLLMYANICAERFSPGIHWKRASEGQPDIEVLYYGKTNTLCFQPHPEYQTSPKETTELFFNMINKYQLKRKGQ